MPFGMLNQVGPRNHALGGVQIPTRKGAILRAKRSRPMTCPASDILKTTQQNQCGADDNWCVLDGGAHWHTCRIWLIVAVMRPYVKLLWPLVIVILFLLLECNRDVALLVTLILSINNYIVNGRLVSIICRWWTVTVETSRKLFVWLYPWHGGVSDCFTFGTDL